MAKKKPKQPSNIIAQNKKARHDYHLEQKLEAGMVLQGWEVKSMRMGKAEIVDCYVLIKDGEAWLLGCHISPLNTVSTHNTVDPTRTRKLLLNQREIARLLDATQKQGLTCVCTKLYWSKHLIKAEICIAKGKQQHDKRQSEKERDWNQQKQRVLRNNS